MEFCKLFQLFTLVFPFCYSSDPHESLSRRTPSGLPFYLSHPSFNGVFYTTSGMLIIEFGTTFINRFKQDGQQKKNYLNITMKTDTMESNSHAFFPTDCQLGFDFLEADISHIEKMKFIKQLDSSCFHGKWDLKIVNLTGDDYTEEHFWNQAWNKCRSKIIPDSLLAPDLLQSVLTNFEENILKPKELQLFVSLESFREYYYLPLASCIFSPNSFILAIQLPVVLTSENMPSEFQYHRLIPIPLWKPDEPSLICRINELTNGDIEGGYHYNSGEIISETQLLCKDNNVMRKPICFFPTKSLLQRPMKKTCVQAIIESMDEDVLCDLTCEQAVVYNLPVIRQVASDRYMILAQLNSNEEIRVECPPFQKEETLVFPSTGVLEVILPCDCHVSYRTLVFRSTTPCGAEFSKIPIYFPGSFEIRDQVSIEDEELAA